MKLFDVPSYRWGPLHEVCEGGVSLYDPFGKHVMGVRLLDYSTPLLVEKAKAASFKAEVKAGTLRADFICR